MASLFDLTNEDPAVADLRRVIDGRLADMRRATEMAAEQSLQLGFCGVATYDWWEGEVWHFEARVCPNAPYGHLHEHQSRPPEVR